MKLVTFVVDGNKQLTGALTGDGATVVALMAGAQAIDGTEPACFESMLSFLRGGPRAIDEAMRVVEFVSAQHPPSTEMPISSVRLLAPVPRPESMRDCMCFEQHIINSIRVVGLKRFAPIDEWIEKTFGRKRSIAYRANHTFYEQPIYYKSNRFSVVGPDHDVRMPSYTDRFDYELEWGVFIGRQGADIPRGKARSYVGGYTIFNDFSARDTQMKEQGGRLGPSKGKDFDTGNAMGPCLVTPDEIADPYNLVMTARVNDEEWSRGTTADMYWSFEDLLEHISRSETLYPGEFIGSGTCSGALGRGCGLEIGRFLKPLDTVELEVEGIGVLRNRVVRG